MLSEYGKILRKIRIDKGLTIAQMAKAIGITSAYLSTIERDNRNIPEYLTKDIVNNCSLSNEQATELQKSEYASRKVLKMNLAGMETERKELLLRLSDNITSLTSSQIKQMNHIMGVN